MKKILKLSIAFLIICMVMIGNVYAMECNVSLELQKTEFEVNEEFTVDFSISNIESNRGVISLQATLEYDKDSLTLVKMEGKNGWETPAEGASYNKENGKIAITRSGTNKNNEVMLSMTFKVKENAKQNPSISLKNISIADGDGMAKFEKISKSITVKNSNTEIGDTQKPSTNKTNSNNKGNYSISSDKTTSNGRIPKTGDTINFVFISIFMLAVLMGIYSFIKIKKLK